MYHAHEYHVISIESEAALEASGRFLGLMVMMMKPGCIICLGALLACLLFASASAAEVSLDRDRIASNEKITATVTNLTDGTHYSQKTTVYQYMEPGMPSAFGSDNITWPFAHEDDVFTMSNENTTQNQVYIGHWWPQTQGGGYEDGLWTGNSKSGRWSDSIHYGDDQTGVYHTTWYSTPAKDARIVTSTFWINGTKTSGSEDFEEELSFWTVNPAEVEIEWYDNNVLHDSESFKLDAVDGAYFIAVPDTLKTGNKIKFTLIPASGKTVKSTWWSFDAEKHLKTWNSRARSPNFFFPRWASGFQSPLVKITYRDGSTETVERTDYVNVISDRVQRTRFFDTKPN